MSPICPSRMSPGMKRNYVRTLIFSPKDSFNANEFGPKVGETFFRFDIIAVDMIS